MPSVQFKAIISDKIAQMRKIDLEATELQATTKGSGKYLNSGICSCGTGSPLFTQMVI